ncbi:hypothetical protein ASPZODRAFT_77129, partial [Penicilliopsis zonata CBS 506.65]
QPNDEDEQDRMDLMHHVYGMALGGDLHTAPINNPQRVLDLGTGTGIWAIDFADQYPSAEVIGNDLSPIQPGWVPVNCVFEVDDFGAEWQYHRAFDYIHGRELAGSIKDIDHLAKQAFDNLRSGGYFELQSFPIEVFTDDDSMEERGKYTAQLIELISEASEMYDKPMQNVDKWGEALESAGFTQVTTTMIKVPISPWPTDPKQKEIGRFMQCQYSQALGSYLPGILTTVLGWSPAETEVMAAKVRQELTDLEFHQYSKLYLIYGKKP